MTRRRPSGRVATGAWLSLWASLIGLGLALKAAQAPLYVFGSIDDDELMVRMAHGFVHGHWSSSWSSTGILTLAKPVGYPIFLAGAHLLPWSPIFTSYLVYLVGAVLACAGWRAISGSWAQSSLVLAALAFSPTLFTYESQRIARDVFIDAVVMVGIGLAFTTAAVLDRRWQRDPQERPRILGRGLPYATAVVLGACVGVVAVTKPTWQWVPAAVVAPLALPVVRQGWRSRRRWRAGLRIGAAAVLAVMAWVAVVGGTKAMNDRTYGVALVEDFSSGAFARAWDAWAGVESGAPRRYVPITRAMRLAVYRNSPTARLLEPSLEAPADFWKTVDCASAVHICDESGNWFEWDLRTAADATGRIRSVADFQRFFGRIADDIEHACSTGAIRCSSAPVPGTGLPPVTRIRLGSVGFHLADGLWQMVDSQLPIGPPTNSQPTPAQYQLWRSVIPGMGSIATVTTTTDTTWPYSVLRAVDRLYGVGDIVLLSVIGLGLLGLLVRRRGSADAGNRRPQALAAACLFLLAAVLGMGTLATFEAAQGPGYVSPLYWADFAAPAELALALGACAFVPRLKALARPRARRA